MIIPNNDGAHHPHQYQNNSNPYHPPPQYQSNHSIMIPTPELPPSSSSSMNRNTISATTTNTTFSDPSMNIGVVSPLVYAAPTVAPSSTAVRTVSSCSSSSSIRGGNSQSSFQIQNPNTNHIASIRQPQPFFPTHDTKSTTAGSTVHHPTPTYSASSYPLYPVISPTPTVPMDAAVPMASNYNWFDPDNNNNNNNRNSQHRSIQQQQQQRPSRTTLLHHSFMTTSASTTTTTPKHERTLPSPNQPNATEVTVLLQQSQSDQHLYSLQQRSATKKQRPNSYIAPRHIPDTFNSRVGTCCWSNTTATNATLNNNNNTNNNSNNNTIMNRNGNSTTSMNHPHPANLRVPFRRQLSSGKIEAFLSSSNGHSSTTDATTTTTTTTTTGMMDVDQNNNTQNSYNNSHNMINSNNNPTTDASSQQQQQRPRSMSF